MAYETFRVEPEEPKLSPELSEKDRLLLAKVQPALEAGRALQAWWEQANAEKQYQESFQLTRAFNQADISFGFFGEATIKDKKMPVMGTVEEMLYDQPKHSDHKKLRDEFREFILHYFLRITDFREPEACIGEQQLSNLPEWLQELSWCPDLKFVSAGFGYSQYFYKKRSNGLVGKFPDNQRFSIVDLRRLISEYEWIVAKVRVFNFDIKFSPFGRTRPQAVVPLHEESYVVLSSDFITDETNPSPEVAGSYGFGYAFIKQSHPGDILAYGPGLFAAAFERITFRILHCGQTRVHLAFVANRPAQVLRFPVLDWTMRVADVASFGMTSRFLMPLLEAWNKAESPGHGFDPLIASLTLANLLSGGFVAQDLCISKKQIEKDMLLQHFRQHYQMLLGSLFTWRQIADWQDADRLPAWVITGTTA
jgi:hypothetical protein